MPADLTNLNQAIADLTAQVAETEGVEASAQVLIENFATQITAAVTSALEADNAADNTSIAAAQQAISDVKARFAASAGNLGAAVAANSGTPQA